MLLFGVTSSFSLAANSETQETERRLHESAFPMGVYPKGTKEPDLATRETIRATRDAVLKQLQVNSRAWFGALFPGQEISPNTQSLVFLSAREMPIFLCSGRSCQGCAQVQQGCVKPKLAGGGIGMALLVAECFFQKDGCYPKSAVRKRSLVDVIESAMSFAAYYKVAVSTESRPAQQAVLRAEKLTRQATRVIRDLVNSCPGPFPSSAETFLKDYAHLQDLSEVLGECGKNYLKGLRMQLPECQSLEMPPRIRSRYQNGIFKRGVRLSRCDAHCHVWTCGPKRNEPHFRTPRVVAFGDRFHLLLPEGACDGFRPTKLREFLELETEPLLGSPQERRCRLKLLTWAQENFPSSAQSEKERWETLSGPEIPLLEN